MMKADSKTSTKIREPPRKSCAYCGKLVKMKEMRVIFKLTKMLPNYVQLFGSEFEEKMRDRSRLFVCANHFAKKKRGKRAYPSLMEKCRFCDLISSQKDMRIVTQNEEELQKWIDNLGVEFAENIKKFTTNYICRAHFENGGQRGELPKNIFGKIKLEDFSSKDDAIKKICPEKCEPPLNNNKSINNNNNLENLSKNYQVMQNCRVCNSKMSSTQMVPVPKNFADFSNWCNVFGANFRNNIAQNSPPHSICLYDFIVGPEIL